MKKFLGILVLGFLWCNVSFAKDFKYKSEIICGPKKVKFVFVYKETKPYFERDYFRIYYDKQGDFVIFNDNTEYPSFTKRYYSHLSAQNGKVTSAILNIESETIYKFQLISDWKRKKRVPTTIIYLNFDKEAMTYSVAYAHGSEKPESKTTGVCWANYTGYWKLN